jgi:O-antigen/teichoic acid export membrane protein
MRPAAARAVRGAAWQSRVQRLLRLFSDEGLTKKATLNSVAAGLDYGARLAVGFVITPFLVRGLGNYYFGAWQVLQRLVGYISPASGRPTQALKFTLANQQNSADYALKRRHVGSTVAVALLFLPLMMAAGAVLSWFAPVWIGAPAAIYPVIRVATGVLAVNLIVFTLVAIPQSVLEGENLGYKCMGLSACTVALGGCFTWAALHFRTGLAGVAAAALAGTVVTGIFYLWVAKRYAPWFGVERPVKGEVARFVGLSWWFMAWNLIMTAMLGSDVVVLGLLDSVEAVTDYSLTKYAPETVINFVAIVAFSIAPGLGGIMGSGDYGKAARVRGEIMTITWLLITSLGSSILLWNRVFIGLWAGPGHYIGTAPSVFVMLMILQFVLIRNDGNVIDLSLMLRNKVLLGGLSVLLSVALSAVLVDHFRLGIVGLASGVMIGRLPLSISYPAMAGRLLKTSAAAQLRAVVRPGLVTILLFGAASGADRWFEVRHVMTGIRWPGFLFFTAITFPVLLEVAFFSGLTGIQRGAITRRLRSLLP